MVTRGNLVDYEYEYRREFEAKIETVQMAESGTYAKPIYAKHLEKLVHCHVPLTCEYLREFLKKFPGALEKMIHENNLKQKISLQCPFKSTSYNVAHNLLQLDR
jgi:hypothetical protein